MIEKPDLPDNEIIACLRGQCGIPALEIEFLPLGNDSSAWVFRVRAEGGQSFFLKVKRGTPDLPGLAVPRFLNDRGIAQVVAPLPNRRGELWTSLGGYALILYPFIEGQQGMEVGLSDRQWVEFGAVMKQIHATALSLELAELVKTETYLPAWSQMVRGLLEDIQNCEYADSHRRALAAFWLERRAEIAALLARSEDLGRALQTSPRELVLCHADAHTANVLLGPHGSLSIVDWDGTLMAPKERDLMFVIGSAGSGGVDSSESARFLEGYGSTSVDPLVLAYYRYEWVVQEIGDFAERVFYMEGLGEETRKTAVEGFKTLFQPGDVVEAAYQSENDLAKRGE